MPVDHRRPHPRTCLFAGAPLLLTSVLLLTCSQVQAAPPSLIPTNDPNAFAFPAPPANFDPIHATAMDLATYGFPPRPKLFTARYFAWARAVSAAKHRIFPDIQLTTRRAEPIASPPPNVQTTVRAPVTTSTSPGWSGLVLSNFAGSFGTSSLYQVWGEWNVTRAALAFGTSCSSAQDNYNSFIGLDGFGSKDMLGSGIGAQICPTPYVDAWYQWYPGSSHVVTNFTVATGDEVVDVVWVTSATVGETFMTDITTGAYWGLQIAPPGGTSLTGDSAEWILGRTCTALPCSTLLANYGAEYFADTEAFYDLSSPTGVGGNGDARTTPYLFSMIDNNSNPISYVAYYQNNYSMFGLRVEGSAK